MAANNPHGPNATADQKVRDPREGTYKFGRLLTIKDGEAFNIWDSKGKLKVVHGPKHLRPFYSEVEMCHKYVCGPGKYLKIQHKDGRMEHLRGPQMTWFDELNHETIEVRDAIKLEANEAIVVYRELREEWAETLDEAEEGSTEKNPREEANVPVAQDQKNRVKRRIVHGPTVFIPAHNEWLHKFSWHGSQNGSKTGAHNDTKVAHAVNFKKIRCMPDHMYYTVREMRTSDDAKLSVHVMIFYVLEDIEKMLDNSNDPPGDFISAAGADIMAFGASRTYEEFLADSNQFGELSTFPILSERMESIGYRLLKVVYRGYDTSGQLQNMQENAISTRTRLRLEFDQAQQEQANMQMRLTAEEKRAQQQQKLEESKKYHQQKLAALDYEAKLKQQDLEYKAKLSQKDESHSQQIRHKKEMDELDVAKMQQINSARLNMLQQMKNLNVDLTQFLVAEVGSKPTQHMLFETTGGGASPHVHINKNR
eukprot:CAMPEP_0204872652 /NCGR_PEP_ID=MMETSP1348-20121228/38434_1 /ASSEMBLY_ACC=CAM_ASM_000700 /TAXON_ID=215587 /ORGANISM="Aplanochytrium stocchinoi, Strain GSBS06" /LENGTH=479 /DNA_ID=CAMNT_0052027559 /DNA_START=151 /DNA_END=1590 /DNA_ORIENTATION=-